MPHSRRQLLASLVGALCLPRAARAQRRDVSVLVVGAGASGLAAARRLHDAGARVTVLEARDRLGGRIWTDRSLGLPIDLGGAWIEGDAGPAMRLARELRLATEVSDFDDATLFDAGGRVIPDARVERAQQQWRDVVRDIERRSDRATRDEPLTVALGAALRRVPPADRTLVEHLAVTEIDEDLGESPSRLSLLAFGEEDEFGGDDRILPGGYAGIVEGLARGLDLRLRHTARRVVRTARAVRVETDRGVFTADRCVVTLPIGVLRAGRVRFEPELPASHREVIERLGVGLLDKVALRFPRLFWPRERHFFSHVPAQPHGLRSFLNAARWSGEPVLVGLLGADAARALESLPDAEATGLAMTSLRAMFGGAIPAPVRSVVTRWSADPFALGAYSCVAVGGTHTMRARLAEPIEDRLFFAGEATHPRYPATVQGALLAGWSAADACLRRAWPDP
jgi:monoamine oxidase